MNQHRSCGAWGRVSAIVRATILLSTFVLIAGAVPTAAQEVFEQWVRRFDGPAHGRDEANAIATDPKGNTYVTGSITVSGKTVAMTAKYSPSGQQLWRAFLSSPTGLASGRAIAADSAGNAYVAFEFELARNNVNLTKTDEFVVAKYNTNGARLWIRFFVNQQRGIGQPVAIALDRFGNAFVTGFLSFSPDANDATHRQWTTIKYGPTGSRLWVANLTHTIDDTPSGLVVDNQGNVYVTGNSFDRGLSNRAITVKYAAASGSELWRDVFDPPTGSQATTTNKAIALGADGNVYVGGNGGATDTQTLIERAHVIKYSPAGTRIWVAQHQSSSGRSSFVSGIAVDRHGNAYVAGLTFRSSRVDSVTMKFDPSGGFAWERFHTNVAFSFRGVPIVLNSLADVYITVPAFCPDGTTTDFATIKYNTHGIEKWVITFDGPGNGNDTPTGIAIRGGGLFVTGSSLGSGTNLDWATIKYLQDGASLNPDSLTFAARPVGTASPAQAVTVTNTADATLQIKSIATSGDFTQSNNCPSTLAPGAQCTIQVKFCPTATGTRTGSLTVTSNWSGSPQVVDLTGTGQ